MLFHARPVFRSGSQPSTPTMLGQGQNITSPHSTHIPSVPHRQHQALGPTSGLRAGSKVCKRDGIVHCVCRQALHALDAGWRYSSISPAPSFCLADRACAAPAPLFHLPGPFPPISSPAHPTEPSNVIHLQFLFVCLPQQDCLQPPPPTTTTPFLLLLLLFSSSYRPHDGHSSVCYWERTHQSPPQV